MRETVAMQPQVSPCSCVIMDFVSDESRRRLVRAARAYSRLKGQFEDARTELAEAIVEERKEGVLIEDITALVPYRQTQVNRIIKSAGLTEARRRQS